VSNNSNNNNNNNNGLRHPRRKPLFNTANKGTGYYRRVCFLVNFIFFLNSEAVEGRPLALDSVHDVKRFEGGSLAVLHVDDGVAKHVL